jgi:hypothetical protein
MLMSIVIFGKLEDVKDLNMISSKYAVLFKRSKEYLKVEELIDQYSLKYEKISKYKNQEDKKEALRAI